MNEKENREGALEIDCEFCRVPAGSPCVTLAQTIRRDADGNPAPHLIRIQRAAELRLA